MTGNALLLNNATTPARQRALRPGYHRAADHRTQLVDHNDIATKPRKSSLGQMVVLSVWSDEAPPRAKTPVGRLTGYTTKDPRTACFMIDPNLNVEPVIEWPDEYLVIATVPGDFANAVLHLCGSVVGAMTVTEDWST
jgi:hypothetical protein